MTQGAYDQALGWNLRQHADFKLKEHVSAYTRVEQDGELGARLTGDDKANRSNSQGTMYKAD